MFGLIKSIRTHDYHIEGVAQVTDCPPYFHTLLVETVGRGSSTSRSMSLSRVMVPATAEPNKMIPSGLAAVAHGERFPE
jgi:hypothetical protein